MEYAPVGHDQAVHDITLLMEQAEAASAVGKHLWVDGRLELDNERRDLTWQSLKFAMGAYFRAVQMMVMPEVRDQIFVPAMSGPVAAIDVWSELATPQARADPSCFGRNQDEMTRLGGLLNDPSNHDVLQRVQTYLRQIGEARAQGLIEPVGTVLCCPFPYAWKPAYGESEWLMLGEEQLDLRGSRWFALMIDFVTLEVELRVDFFSKGTAYTLGGQAHR